MVNVPRKHEAGTSPLWVRVFWGAALLVLLAFAALHLSGHGMGHHGGMP
jgi:hypothetical protein